MVIVSHSLPGLSHNKQATSVDAVVTDGENDSDDGNGDAEDDDEGRSAVI